MRIRRSCAGNSTRGKLSQSLSKLDQAAAQSGKLLQAYPDAVNSKKLHARVQLGRADLLFELGQVQESVQACQASIDILKPLLDTNQLDAMNQEILVLAFARFSAGLRRLQRLDEAAEACRLGGAILASEAEELDRDQRHIRARLLLEQARVQIADKQAAATIEPSLQEAVEIWQKLYEQFPETRHYQTFLAESHAELGRLGVLEDDADLAKASFDEAARLARLFGDSEPPTFEVSKSAGYILMVYSLAESQTGNARPANQLASEAQRYLSAAQALAPESQEIAQWLSDLPIAP